MGPRALSATGVTPRNLRGADIGRSSAVGMITTGIIPISHPYGLKRGLLVHVGRDPRDRRFYQLCPVSRSSTLRAGKFLAMGLFVLIQCFGKTLPENATLLQPGLLGDLKRVALIPDIHIIRKHHSSIHQLPLEVLQL